MPKRTMLTESSGKLTISVHSRANPSDEEWNSLLDGIRQLPDLGNHRVIVYSAGGGPDVSQRHRLLALFEGRKAPPTALITDELVARGIATAMSWFRVNMKAFRTDQREHAFRYLDLSPEEAARVTGTLDRFIRELADAR